MDDSGPMIIISDVLEYLFCPRFIYFMHCLDIPQHEELKYKVIRGREVHLEKGRMNPNYLRKRLGVIRRERDVFLASEELHIKGIVDEVLFLNDGTAAPLEYKFAEFKQRVFKTYRYQLALHALMIQDLFDVTVNRGYLCFTRSNDHIEEVWFSKKDFEESRQVVRDILEIIETGEFPKRASNASRCVDCCYRNICA